MAGRFPLYTDDDVLGALVKTLQRAGWDVVRGVDTLPKKTPDPEHFEKAAQLDRVLVTNDPPRRHRSSMDRRGSSFEWNDYLAAGSLKRMSIGDLLRKFEEQAAKDQPFDPDYPIVRFKPD